MLHALRGCLPSVADVVPVSFFLCVASCAEPGITAAAVPLPSLWLWVLSAIT
jgi:hypothetical protein